MIPLPTITPMMVVLAISLAANAGLGWAYLGQRDETTAAAGQRDQARADATACSDAAQDLRELADKRARGAAPLRAAAASAAKERSRRADTILSTPAPVQGDACASAQSRVDDWLKGRIKP